MINRSSDGMKDDSTPRRDVLPEPVPPETTMLAFARTQAPRNSIICFVSAPESNEVFGGEWAECKLPMVITGPQSERGG